MCRENILTHRHIAFSSNTQHIYHYVNVRSQWQHCLKGILEHAKVFSFLGGEVEDRFVIHENANIPSYTEQPEILK